MSDTITNQKIGSETDGVLVVPDFGTHDPDLGALNHTKATFSQQIAYTKRILGQNANHDFPYRIYPLLP